jgi:RNA polymerase sigma factor (sigma-70 family)
VTTLERIVSDHAAMVRHVGRRYRLSDADLDEVAQEVRIRLWRATQRFAEVPTSYVYRASTSAAVDLLRRRRARHADSTLPLDEVAEPVSDAGDPWHAVEESELAARLARAIEEIPASRRPAVRLYLAGHSWQEVAAATGWSLAKARNLVYRGLSDLKQRWAGVSGRRSRSRAARPAAC